MQSVELKNVLTGIRPGGCCQPYLEDFAAELISVGYTVLSAREYVRSAAHLGRWMNIQDIGIDRLSEEIIVAFANHECECPGTPQQRPCYVPGPAWT